MQGSIAIYFVLLPRLQVHTKYPMRLRRIESYLSEEYCSQMVISMTIRTCTIRDFESLWSLFLRKKSLNAHASHHSTGRRRNRLCPSHATKLDRSYFKYRGLYELRIIKPPIPANSLFRTYNFLGFFFRPSSNSV